MGRHHAPDRPDRHPQHPDRLGAHELSPLRPDQVPVEQLLRRLRAEGGATWTR